MSGALRARRSGNAGATSIKRRRRAEDPMRAYDRLPGPLRAWLAQAVLPWSPGSCLRIWRNGVRTGLAPAEIVTRLDRLEAAALERERGRPPPP